MMNKFIQKINDQLVEEDKKILEKINFSRTPDEIVQDFVSLNIVSFEQESEKHDKKDK